MLEMFPLGSLQFHLCLLCLAVAGVQHRRLGRSVTAEDAVVRLEQCYLLHRQSIQRLETILRRKQSTQTPDASSYRIERGERVRRDHLAWSALTVAQSAKDEFGSRLGSLRHWVEEVRALQDRELLTLSKNVMVTGWRAMQAGFAVLHPSLP